ncbi:MAG TPA: SDR family oxidoreductase [Solirubrobacterales bacterium]|jgi:nucleoside-diphosphate-sugar epimerase
MEVAIAGGHGNVARRLGRLLADRGDLVRGLIRNPGHAEELREDGTEPVLCDLEAATPDQIAAAIAGADAVVFAAGAGPGSGSERKGSMDRDGAIKLLHAAEIANVDRYLMVSSIGAEDPPDGDEVFSVYLRAKAEADRALMASDRTWSILRPTSLTDGPGGEGVSVTMDPHRGEVSREDVAAVLAAALHEPRTAGKVIYVRSGDLTVGEALEAFLAEAAP